MKNSFFHKLGPLLLLGTILLNACNGQINSTSNQETPPTRKPVPEIIGTPPPKNPTHNPYNDSNLVSQYIRCIFQDSKGQYWFGPAGQSVARYDGKSLRYFSKEEFFAGNDAVETESGNSVHAIAEDQQGNIWFGTNYGAVKYDGKTFSNYTEKDGLSNPNISRQCILVDKAGKVWIGTSSGIFQYIPSTENTDKPSFTSFSLLPEINSKAIMEDSKGNIWFASATQGVFRYDGKDIKQITEQDGLGDSYAGGMAEDKEGNIWFTMKAGITRYDGSNFTNITNEDGIGGTEIWGMLIEKSGIIWITARGSTTRFNPALPLSNPKAFQVFTVEDGLNCCVQSMYQDQEGNMWWGTGQGLYRFDGQSFYQVKQDGPW
ncbi:MAG: two-component regulator propeller domain-containing protein [Bacteroidota bacterium]